MSYPRIALASSSPRRRELLAQLGVDFQLVKADIDETPYPKEAPELYVTRLARQKGQRIELVWDRIQLQLTPTPAGLLERGRFDGFDLRLSVTEESPVSLASALARGDKPKVRIEGDVQLAAEVNWLIDHVRWDAEEDLARLVGDAAAHSLAQAARKAMQALRGFVAQRAPGTSVGAAA